MNNLTHIFYGSVAIVLLLMNAVLLDNTKSHNQEMAKALESIEGRIQLHDGKATLFEGEACIIKNEALQDEKMAINLAKACVKASLERAKPAL